MIYVITHKIFDDEVVPSEGYRILHVGDNNNCKPSYLRDDVGINISCKNSSYCELTGLYWIWKNGSEKENDPVGLVHYRRFFTTKKENLIYSYFGQIPTPLSIDTLEKSIESPGSIVLPEPIHSVYSLETAYSINHDINDLRVLRDIIRCEAPEYLSDFDNVFKSNEFFGYNMIVCKKKELDQYCEWLFKVLFAAEKVISSQSKSNAYQKRVFGFLGERLLQVWVKHHSQKVHMYPVYNTEKRTDTLVVRKLKRIKEYQLKIKRIKAFNINDLQNKEFHI